jgi:hypothetical protein
MVSAFGNLFTRKINIFFNQPEPNSQAYAYQQLVIEVVRTLVCNLAIAACGL